MTSSPESFPTSIERLPNASAPQLVELGDGDKFDPRIAPVAKRIGDEAVRMLAYNGSIPGPTLKVPEGAEVEVRIEQAGLEQVAETSRLRTAFGSLSIYVA
jgi:FtsP/CotA-like multicopper oxidase with cupredoxin domain